MGVGIHESDSRDRGNSRKVWLAEYRQDRSKDLRARLNSGKEVSVTHVLAERDQSGLELATYLPQLGNTLPSPNVQPHKYFLQLPPG